MKDSDVKSVYAPISKAWAHFPPPVRPSKEEISLYEKGIAIFGANPKALILGVTPELRDLCAKLGLDTTLVDVSQEMIKDMDSLVTQKNPKEKTEIANWLEMSFGQKFDVILGDICINLFQLEEWPKFLSKMRELLSEKGVLVTRVMLDVPTRPDSSVRKVVEQFRAGKKMNLELDRTAAFFTDSDIYNPKTGKMDQNFFNKRLEEMLSGNELSQEEFDALKLPVTRIPLVVPTQKHFDGLCSGLFETAFAESGKQFAFSKYFLVYALKKA